MENKLTVFSRAVIPVYTTETGDRVVLGREMHERLNLSERYSKWFERMCGYGFKEQIDYTPYQMVHPQNGQEMEDHILKLDMAKHIAMIQRTPEGKAIRDQLIALETNVSELSPELRVLIGLELKQKEQARAIAAVSQRVDDIRDVVALNPVQWREESQSIIANISRALGGVEHIRDIHAEIYALVDTRAGCCLKRRLENLKARSTMEGCAKSKVNALNKLDVIGQDKKLIEIYVAIVKEMAVKHGVIANKEEI